MKRSMQLSILSAFLFLAIGCSTTAQFKVPPGTNLTVYERPVAAGGTVKTAPFFWTASGGIPYALTDSSGKVVREGRLKSKFRVISIFWPPFSLIYWPMGFGSPMYDLTQPADGYMVRDAKAMAAAPEALTPAPTPTPKTKK